MFVFVITMFVFLGPVLARPQESQPGPAATQSGSTPIPIINQTEEVNPDGSFKYSYETGNGIKVEESGHLKDGGEGSTDKIQVIEGSVSYTDSEGKVINLRYIADENGFQPEGDHLPTPPSPIGAAPNALKALPEQPTSQPKAKPPAPPAANPPPQVAASESVPEEAQSESSTSTQ